VLHRPDDGPAGSGLDRLSDLVERARSADLPVTLTVSGQRRELPTGIDRTAYRVVQEALTNITRHAGQASASLHLGYGRDEARALRRLVSDSALVIIGITAIANSCGARPSTG
jgi:signal transduction histidine kinase